MLKRKGISKRVRFEIFKRDSFRCFHCGATPNDGPMHLDHLKPVAEGGTNDPSNLVTACVDCNLGKGAVPLDRIKLHKGKATEAQREQAEQVREWMKIQQEVHAAKDEVTESLTSMWLERVGSEPQNLAARMSRALAVNTMEQIREAIDVVAIRMHRERETEQLKYFYGCLKKMRNGESGPKAPRTTADTTATVSACCARTRRAIGEACAFISKNISQFKDSQDTADHVVRAAYKAVGLPFEQQDTEWLAFGVAIGPISIKAAPTEDGKHVSWSVTDNKDFNPWKFAYDEAFGILGYAIDADPQKPDAEWVDPIKVLELHAKMIELGSWSYDLEEAEKAAKKK